MAMTTVFASKPAEWPNSFNAPNFNFPKKVEENARPEFESALKAHDGVRALKAAIQLDIAAGQVSAESANASLARFDTVAAAMPVPYSGLAMLLEAQLYADIYTSQSWIFDNRLIPENPVPENVMEWNHAMFANKVKFLVGEAMKQTDACASMPLSTITEILADSEDAEKAGFSVADFMSLKGMDVLTSFRRQGHKTIPFGNTPVDVNDVSTSGGFADFAHNTPAQLFEAILLSSIRRHESDKDKFILSYFCEKRLHSIPSPGERKDYLAHCVDLFGNTPYGGAFLVEYCNMVIPDDMRKRYNLLSDYLKRFPDCLQLATVQSAINNLLQKCVNISFQNKLLPGVAQELTVSGKNIYDFYVLAYRLNGKKGDDFVTYGELAALDKPVQAVKVHCDGSSPDLFNEKIVMPALDPGVYAFVASNTPNSKDFIETNRKIRVQTATVSALTTIVSTGDREDRREMYVVSAFNQQPQPGAKVTLWDNRRNNSLVKHSVLTTDSEGRVSIPSGSFNYTVEYGGSVVEGYLYKNYYGGNAGMELLKASVLTDLSIYRPGDTARFSAIAYAHRSDKLLLAPDRKLKLVLLNANGQSVDSLTLVTDAQSRVAGSFVLPKTGLLGDWSISVNEGEKSIGQGSFEVVEYKAPTFYAVIESSSESFQTGDEIKFQGRAATYSGMPVADAKVSYSVSYQPVWWRHESADASFGGETKTMSDGSFIISLPTNGLKDTEFATGSFNLSVAVTDRAGETADAPSMRFSLGSAFNIVSSIPGSIEITGTKFNGKVSVYDMTGHPVQKKVYYEISTASTPLLKGEFEAPGFAVDAAKLPSGRYEMRFSLTPDFVSTDECRVLTDSVTIWRNTDVRPAETTPLWVPVTQVVAPAAGRKVEVRVGSSYADSWILAQFCTDKTSGKARWVKVSDGIAKVEVDVPGEWDRAYVMLVGTHNLDTRRATVTVIPYDQQQQLQIMTESFRNKVDPGSSQDWKFSFSIDGKPMPNLPVMAVMSNKALNAIVPFQWSFNPFDGIYRSSAMHLDLRDRYSMQNSVSLPIPRNQLRDIWIGEPSWNTYGYSLYSGMRVRYGASRNMMMKQSAPAAAMGAVVSNMTDDSVAMTESVATDYEEESARVVSDSGAVEGKAADSGSDRDANDVSFRDLDCPLAFFMPELTTDAQGVATISFTAPEFVGTWQLQLLGYTPELRGAVSTFDVISAKSVMAQLNAPRFLRTDDRATISATLYNNTDSDLPIRGSIQILDALTEESIASADFEAQTVSPSGSRVVSSSFDVPSNLNAVIIRAFAASENHRDGEQTMVPIYPCTTPVTESTPFYLQQGEEAFSIKLPQFSEDASVTLTYCDNPIWECVTALPSMVRRESVNILSAAYALYGNAVAASLFGKYPQIEQGIRLMAAEENKTDSTLVSPLQRNAELKNFLLNNTPWVNDAQSETLRMQSLLDYADRDRSAEAIAGMMKAITDLQNADGGWSWCPDMKSSEFITMQVIHVLASLADMDCLPAGAEKPLSKACRYVDNLLARSWNESGRKYVPVKTLLHYLCDKSALPKVGSTSDFKPLEIAAMKKISAGWGDFGIADKATAAILLNRRGQSKTARTILESLREYASVSKEKGMWFDNLSGSRNADRALLATSRVLDAFAEIEPDSPDVDLLRQWLVVSKQTQNWGDSRSTSAVIHGLLTSGSDWTVSSDTPKISIGGNDLPMGKVAAITGAVVVNLNDRNASGSLLTIERSGRGPAWGGVIAKYVAPILEVKEDRIPELSIRKNVYAITETATGKKAENRDFRVGDRVRVMLTINCDRDLDYVAIADGRSACMEPVDQVSSYTSSDGVWFYRDVRTESTNIFIPYLSKGSHVISYECNLDRPGEYSLGIASAQSQYAPTIAAHSAGSVITVLPPNSK